MGGAASVEAHANNNGNANGDTLNGTGKKNGNIIDEIHNDVRKLRDKGVDGDEAIRTIRMKYIGTSAGGANSMYERGGSGMTEGTNGHPGTSAAALHGASSHRIMPLGQTSGVERDVNSIRKIALSHLSDNLRSNRDPPSTSLRYINASLARQSSDGGSGMAGALSAASGSNSSAHLSLPSSRLLAARSTPHMVNSSSSSSNRSAQPGFHHTLHHGGGVPQLINNSTTLLTSASTASLLTVGAHSGIHAVGSVSAEQLASSASASSLVLQRPPTINTLAAANSAIGSSTMTLLSPIAENAQVGNNNSRYTAAAGGGVGTNASEGGSGPFSISSGAAAGTPYGEGSGSIPGSSTSNATTVALFQSAAASRTTSGSASAVSSSLTPSSFGSGGGMNRRRNINNLSIVVQDEAEDVDDTVGAAAMSDMQLMARQRQELHALQVSAASNSMSNGSMYYGTSATLHKAADQQSYTEDENGNSYRVNNSNNNRNSVNISNQPRMVNHSRDVTVDAHHDSILPGNSNKENRPGKKQGYVRSQLAGGAAGRRPPSPSTGTTIRVGDFKIRESGMTTEDGQRPSHHHHHHRRKSKGGEGAEAKEGAAAGDERLQLPPSQYEAKPVGYQRQTSDGSEDSVTLLSHNSNSYYDNSTSSRVLDNSSSRISGTGRHSADGAGPVFVSLGGSFNFIEIGALGSGASGTVVEALHIPTLTIVALKMLPCYNQQKKENIASELAVLYQNMADLRLVDESLDDENVDDVLNGSTRGGASSVADSRRTSSTGLDAKGDQPLLSSLFSADAKGSSADEALAAAGHKLAQIVEGRSNSSSSSTSTDDRSVAMEMKLDSLTTAADSKDDISRLQTVESSVAESKKVTKQRSQSSPSRQRQQRNSKLKKKRCPYILAMYDAFTNPKTGLINLVVEYMDGGSLADVVKNGGCQEEVVLCDIAEQVLMGLKYLHENKQMHRDVKPGNILLNCRGNVKLADFGISKALDGTGGFANSFVGTVTYMSPERIMGDSYGFPSDIWSFGLTLLTVAEGKFPFSAADSGYWGMIKAVCDEPAPEPTNPYFSPEFRDFIALSLHKNQELRGTAVQLLQHPFITQYKPEHLPPQGSGSGENNGLEENRHMRNSTNAPDNNNHMQQQLGGSSNSTASSRNSSGKHGSGKQAAGSMLDSIGQALYHVHQQFTGSSNKNGVHNGNGNGNNEHKATDNDRRRNSNSSVQAADEQHSHNHNESNGGTCTPTKNSSVIAGANSALSVQINRLRQSKVAGAGTRSSMSHALSTAANAIGLSSTTEAAVVSPLTAQPGSAATNKTGNDDRRFSLTDYNNLQLGTVGGGNLDVGAVYSGVDDTKLDHLDRILDQLFDLAYTAIYHHHYVTSQQQQAQQQMQMQLQQYQQQVIDGGAAGGAMVPYGNNSHNNYDEPLSNLSGSMDNRLTVQHSGGSGNAYYGGGGGYGSDVTLNGLDQSSAPSEFGNSLRQQQQQQAQQQGYRGGGGGGGYHHQRISTSNTDDMLSLASDVHDIAMDSMFNSSFTTSRAASQTYTAAGGPGASSATVSSGNSAGDAPQPIYGRNVRSNSIKIQVPAPVSGSISSSGSSSSATGMSVGSTAAGGAVITTTVVKPFFVRASSSKGGSFMSGGSTKGGKLQPFTAPAVTLSLPGTSDSSESTYGAPVSDELVTGAAYSPQAPAEAKTSAGRIAVPAHPTALTTIPSSSELLGVADAKLGPSDAKESADYPPVSSPPLTLNNNNNNGLALGGSGGGGMSLMLDITQDQSSSLRNGMGYNNFDSQYNLASVRDSGANAGAAKFSYLNVHQAAAAGGAGYGANTYNANNGPGSQTLTSNRSLAALSPPPRSKMLAAQQRSYIHIPGFTSISDVRQWRHLANQLYLPYDVVILAAKLKLGDLLEELLAMQEQQNYLYGTGTDGSPNSRSVYSNNYMNGGGAGPDGDQQHQRYASSVGGGDPVIRAVASSGGGLRIDVTNSAELGPLSPIMM